MSTYEITTSGMVVTKPVEETEQVCPVCQQTCDPKYALDCGQCKHSLCFSCLVGMFQIWCSKNEKYPIVYYACPMCREEIKFLTASPEEFQSSDLMRCLLWKNSRNTICFQNDCGVKISLVLNRCEAGCISCRDTTWSISYYFHDRPVMTVRTGGIEDPKRAIKTTFKAKHPIFNCRKK
uniref:RING-type domain-containing protein n=1 Tax=viral metagenome TaxID=1070528 RepID=A0A6C0JUD9_9ZZZZ